MLRVGGFSMTKRLPYPCSPYPIRESKGISGTHLAPISTYLLVPYQQDKHMPKNA